jgi:voltage-gated potassium channel
MATEGSLSLGRAVYFSFVTLATLGYGDIVPASDAAAGVTIVEAMIGQFYLVVLVARLVSLYARADADRFG